MLHRGVLIHTQALQVVKHLFDRVRAISEIHNCHAEYWRGLKYALYMVIDTVCGLGAVFVE